MSNTEGPTKAPDWADEKAWRIISDLVQAGISLQGTTHAFSAALRAEREAADKRFADMTQEQAAAYCTHDTLALERAEKELAARNEWQAIETAPRDNRMKLTWAIVDTETGNWNMRLSSWLDHEQRWDSWPTYCQPTHWQPLPKPPARKSEPPQGESNETTKR